MKKAVFCGTFDPFTLGHLDILKKAGAIFDKVYLAVPFDNSKHTKSTPKDRIEIAKASTENLDFVEVVSFSGLLTDFCKAMKVFNLIRGIRNSVDFVFESDLIKNYKTQCDILECTYFIPETRLEHISSSIVRELVALGGNLEEYVSKNALPLILEAYKV